MSEHEIAVDEYVENAKAKGREYYRQNRERLLKRMRERYAEKRKGIEAARKVVRTTDTVRH